MHNSKDINPRIFKAYFIPNTLSKVGANMIEALIELMLPLRGVEAGRGGSQMNYYNVSYKENALIPMVGRKFLLPTQIEKLQVLALLGSFYEPQWSSMNHRCYLEKPSLHK
jgi:hypothetical protein